MSSSALGEQSSNTLPGPQKPTFRCPQIMDLSLFSEVRKGGRKWCGSINQKATCQRDCHNALACLPRSDSMPSFFHYFIHSIHFLFKFLRCASLYAWYRECKMRKTSPYLKQHGIHGYIDPLFLYLQTIKKWTPQDRNIQTALNLTPLLLWYTFILFAT